MTRAEKINKIRMECVLVNPEIIRLQRGCEVREVRGEGRTLVVLDDNLLVGVKDGRFGTKYHDVNHVMRDFQILGRKIGVADIFRALHFGKFGDEATLKMEQELCYQLVLMWDMVKDDLRDASDDCLDFILTLLNNGKL